MVLRIVFMGTPEFSVPTLDALVNAGHEIVACYTQPPRPAGRRGLDLVKSPVQLAAERHAIAVNTPRSLNSEDELQRLQKLAPDVGVVVAYGLLLPQAVLDVPRLGFYNGHASLLPRWRGAAPIQRAIMAGDRQTGMMVMKMEAGLDTGPVAMQQQVPIDEETTAGDLHDLLADAGARLMVAAMAKLEQGSLELRQQPQEGITYASKISKDETRIDWSAPASVVQRHIMGLSPFPGAWCEMEFSGRRYRVKVLRASLQEVSGPPGTVLDGRLTIACSDGSVRLEQLQRAGSWAMDGNEFLRGYTVPTGSMLE